MTLNTHFPKIWRNIPLFALMLTCSIYARAQTQPQAFKQSIYYDAKVIYYALKNYDAFPVFVKSEQVTTTSGTGAPATAAPATTPTSAGQNTGPNSGLPPATTIQPATIQITTKTINHYKIVQSSTGNILANDVTDTDLQTELKKDTFANDSAREAVINQILADNDGTTENKSFTAFQNKYISDDFLKILFDGKSKTYVTNSTAGAGGATASISGGSGLPSINTIAQGLAGFYIDRLNQEVDEAFFIRLQEALSSKPELKDLLPNTIAALGKIKVTSYHQSLNLLKAAFQQDLDNILHNLTLLGTIPEYQVLAAKYQELTLLLTAADVISMVKDERTPADIFYRVDTASYIRLNTITGPKGDINGYIRIASTLSNSLIDLNMSDQITSGYKWVTPAQLADFNNTDLFQIYMGLVALHLKGVTIGGVAIDGALRKNATAIVTSKTVIFNIINTTQILTNQIQSLKQTTNVPDKAGAYLDMTGTLLGFADNLLKTLPPSAESKKILASVTTLQAKVLPALKSVIPVVKDIQAQNYSTAINDAGPLITQISSIIPAGTKDATEQKIQKTLATVHDIFMQYGPFLAAMAEAKTPDDVKSAITAFALPSGSSRIKKEHTFSWGLNSYVGVYHSWNHDATKYNMPNEETGITAPMGIALSWGLPKGAGSITLYGGVIDIGAIFAYQVNNDNSIQSSIKLGQLLSPSIGFAYGCFMVGKYNIPLSIGVNQQWGPKLKSIDSNGNSVLNSLTSRTNIFIAIDIPIVNFHVSEK